MKKKYIAPTLTTISIDTDCPILNASMTIGSSNGNKVTTESEVLSTDWDSSMWSWTSSDSDIEE